MNETDSNDKKPSDQLFRLIERSRNARSISYLDLVNLETIDCTNHPMYRMAHKIEQLKLALFEKTEETRRLKKETSHKH